MRTEHSVAIAAEPAHVWTVMTDVERWPEWTESVTSVELLQPGPLAVGSEARIAQPRFGTQTWRVTAVEPGTSFTWEARSRGAHLVGVHAIEAAPDGGSTVTLTVESSGWAVTLFGWLLARTGRRFIEMEAAGLKRRTEELAAG